jgi:mRNA-degrading endonuclease toxin of MazEF toxin-antitoxin module
VLQGQPLFNDVREIGLWLEFTPQAGSEQCGEVPEGYAISGVVLSDQLKSLDWRLRQVKFIEPASSDVRAMVTSRVLPVLEPDTPATL